YQEGLGRQRLNDLMAQSGRMRDKSIKTGRANSAARGMLNSSIALGQEADVNMEYDQMNDSYGDSFAELMHQLSRQRLRAQNQYDDARTMYDKMNAVGGLNANSPGGVANENNPGGTPYDTI